MSEEPELGEELIRLLLGWFRALAENFRQVLFVVTPDPPRMDYISPTYEGVFGRPLQEVYERADAWIDSVHPENRHDVAIFFERSMQGIPTFMEYRLIRADGTLRWIHSRSFPARDSEGTLVYVVGVAEDITDRKRALELTEAAREAAEAANRAKGEFLARVSREIRTPLNAIIGTTDLLLDSGLTPEQTEHLRTLRISAESLLVILNNILDFSKTGGG